MRFELRHAHAIDANSSRVVFTDIAPSGNFVTEGSYTLLTKPVKVSRARSQAHFFDARNSHRAGLELLWDETDVLGPDVRSRETLQMLAKMTNNAYFDDRGKKGWYDIGPQWNSVCTAPACELYVLMRSARPELSLRLGA